MGLTIDFAFEGFRLIGKQFGLFLTWCLYYVLLSVVSLGALALLSGPALLTFINQAAGRATPQSDPTVILALLSGIAPGLTVAVIISLIGSLMFRCAVYRSMLKPSDKSPAYLKLGGDELRQFLLALLMIVVVLGVYLIIAIGAGIVIGVSTMAKNEVVSGLVMFFVVVAAIVALFWFILRISLIGVYTFDKAKISLGGALKLTKGKVWTLFGGYIILAILLMIVQIVTSSVFYGITLTATGFNMEPLRQAANPDFTQIMSMLGPVFIVQMLIGVITAVLGEVAFLAATVAAYRALTPAPVDAVVAAFEEVLPDKL